MEQWLYVMFIEKTKTYNKLTKAAVERHVANLRQLDEEGHIELAGVFKGYPGVAGMYILRAGSYEEAEALCQAELDRRGWVRKDAGWHFERYNCPRFTTPDAQGNVILDYGVPLASGK